MSRTSPWEVPKTPWAQGGPQSDNQNLWCRWWEGPSDPSVDEGPGRWEHLPSTEIRSHEGKAMSYGSLWRANSRILNNISIGGVS
jgi:hypothetical protein